MKALPVQQAVGTVLCHDITQIVPGQFKGVAFKKGHVIQRDDIPRLLEIGKEHIYVWDLQQGLIHENDAAIRMAQAAAGVGIRLSEPKEGRVNLEAEQPGLLQINLAALYRINEIEQVIFSTLHTNQTVYGGKTVAGTKIIPLVIEQHKIEAIEEICRAYSPVVAVKPFRSLKVGLVITGSEVYKGRIKDAFGPVIRRKLEQLGSQVHRTIFALDDAPMIAEGIQTLLAEGVDLITVTGGMSVDPDDVTPSGIKAAGGELVTYGSPVFPGGMFLLAYIGDVPVMGLPGCVMYSKATVFDLVLPRILAGDRLSRSDIIELGHGGLCTNCPECRFPDCGFGKG